MAKEPLWLTELLEQAEQNEKDRQIEMNKVKADQALAAVSSLEDKLSEVELIAEQEILLISNWKESETSKLKNAA